MNDAIKKAFDFAADLTKQLITLSTGLIALTISFQRDILGGAQHLQGTPKTLLEVGWGLYMASLVTGLWTLMGLTGSLEPKNPRADYVPSIRGSNVVLPSTLQVLSFLLAILFTVLAAAKAWK